MSIIPEMVPNFALFIKLILILLATMVVIKVIHYLFNSLNSGQSSSLNKQHNIDDLIARKKALLTGQINSTQSQDSKKNETIKDFITIHKSDYQTANDLFNEASWGDGAAIKNQIVKLEKKLKFKVDTTFVTKCLNDLGKHPVSNPSLFEKFDDLFLTYAIFYNFMVENSSLFKYWSQKFIIEEQFLTLTRRFLHYEAEANTIEEAIDRAFSIKDTNFKYDIFNLFLHLNNHSLLTPELLIELIRRKAMRLKYLKPLPQNNTPSNRDWALHLFLLPHDAKTSEIKERFKYIATNAHPDKFRDIRSKKYEEIVNSNFQIINGAYQTLLKHNKN